MIEKVHVKTLSRLFDFVRDEEVAGSNPVIPTRSNPRQSRAWVLFCGTDVEQVHPQVQQSLLFELSDGPTYVPPPTA